MNQIARGIITPILTPMYDDESINYEELKNQVERLILDTLVNGGAGAIAGCSNIYPKTICSIYTSFMAGDLDAALKAQKSLIPLRNTFKYGNPNTMIKCATRMLGYPVGSTRAPFNAIPPEGIEALCKVLEDGTRLGME